MIKLPDQDNRDLAVNDLATTYLVEAAAGTGKTTLLVSRMLSAVRAGVRLTEIAAITFTEKAAGELKERLRLELERAKLAQALEDLERAQVSTIHSFCAWLLKERPVEAGVDPQFQVADQLQADLLREEAWAEWFAREAAAVPEERAPLRRLLAVGMTPESLWSLAGLVVENRHRLEKAPATAKPRPLLKVLREIERFVGEIENLRVKANASDKFAEAIEDWFDRLAQAEGVEPWEAEALMLAGPILLTELKGQKWKPHDLFEQVKKLGVEIEQRRAELADALLRDALAWLQGFVAHYAATKRARNLLDFDDLLALTHRLLANHPGVRDGLRRRFRHVLVDEFQDTDPVQVEIVEQLSGKVPGRLFLVGDPKQSIYAFRGADIELYQAVAGRIKVLTIQTNFRSRSTLLDWVNEVFKPVIKPPADGSYQPDYVKLIAAPKNLSDAPAVIQLLPEGELSSKGDARPLEADAIARCLRQLHEKWKWSDMAMLFCTTTALGTFLDALRRYEVPYRVIGGKDFYVRQETQTLASLLGCLDNPADKLSLVAVLRSPIFGWTDEQVFLAHQANGLKDFAGNDLLRSLHARRHDYSVAGFVEVALNETKMCEAFYTKPDGEACVLNLLKALELARALEAAGLRSLRAFVRRLRRSVFDEFEEEPSPSTEEGDDVVRVLTVHRAKGLEFPVVVMADLCGASQDRGASLLTEHTTGQLELRFNKLTTAGFATANARQKLRDDAEEIRLLYVAATRAKEQLIVPWFVPANKPGRARHLMAGIGDNLMTSLTAADFVAEPKPSPALRIEFDRKATGSKPIAKRRAWQKQRAELLARAGLPVARTSPSKLAHESEPREPVGGGRERAMELGVLVHDALERMDATGLAGQAKAMVERALRSELLHRVEKAEEVYRELPFSTGAMDGKIDLLFREGKRWTLVDYKTDAQPDAEKYRPQMSAYCEALEKVGGVKVDDVLLCFLATGQEVKL